jgi:hypothetical protein
VTEKEGNNDPYGTGKTTKSPGYFSQSRPQAEDPGNGVSR